MQMKIASYANKKREKFDHYEIKQFFTARQTPTTLSHSPLFAEAVGTFLSVEFGITIMACR